MRPIWQANCIEFAGDRIVGNHRDCVVVSSRKRDLQRPFIETLHAEAPNYDVRDLVGIDVGNGGLYGVAASATPAGGSSLEVWHLDRQMMPQNQLTSIRSEPEYGVQVSIASGLVLSLGRFWLEVRRFDGTRLEFWEFERSETPTFLDMTRVGGGSTQRATGVAASDRSLAAHLFPLSEIAVFNLDGSWKKSFPCPISLDPDFTDTRLHIDGAERIWVMSNSQVCVCTMAGEVIATLDTEALTLNDQPPGLLDDFGIDASGRLWCHYGNAVYEII